MDCTKLCNVKFFNFLPLTFDSVSRSRFRSRIPYSGFHVLVLPISLISSNFAEVKIFMNKHK